MTLSKSLVQLDLQLGTLEIGGKFNVSLLKTENLSTASLKYLKNPFYIPILMARENNVSSQDPNMAEIQDGSVSVGKDLTAFALKNENINLYLEVYIIYCCTHKS